MILILKGSDINARDKQGETPMHDAAQYDNMDIIELLISKKAKINIEGSDGRAPIHLAIANGNIDIMDLLKKC